MSPLAFSWVSSWPWVYRELERAAWRCLLLTTTVLVLAVALLGCAGPTIFAPITPGQYATKNEEQTAFQLADTKCRAVELNAVAQMPRHVPRAEQTVIIGQSPARPPVNFARNFNDSYARSSARYARSQTARANYKACMAAEGFIEQKWPAQLRDELSRCGLRPDVPIGLHIFAGQSVSTKAFDTPTARQGFS